MGNSLTSPCGQSPQQILQANFNSFNIPTHLISTDKTLQQHGNVSKIEGKQNIQAILFSTKNYFNIVDSRTQIMRYYQRFQGNDSQQFPIVKVHAIKQMQEKNICSTWKWYYVITQNIIPFDQISTSLTFEQCLYALFDSLMGFFYLYAKNRAFAITQKMIGVNSQGKVKVWLHQNYGQNHPENETIELYLTKSYNPPDQVLQNQNRIVLERQMIKEILNIITKKYKGNQNTFEMTLRKRIRQFINEFSIKSCGFKDFLEALSIFQEKSGDQLYIPNRLKLQKEYISKIPQRETFSQKLQRAIERYNAQILAMRKQQEKQRSFSTGISGNSMKRLHVQELPQIVIVQKPKVTFNMDNRWRITEYSDKQSSRQYQKRDLVRYAESEMIGMRGTTFSQRMEDFNFRPQVNIQTYVPGDYESEIEQLSKDMRQTYYQSSGESRSYTLKSNFMNHDEKLTSYGSESQWMPVQSHYIPSQYTSSPSMKSQDKMLNHNQSSKKSYNLMQINEQLQGKQESIRPSLMSINIDGKNSFENRTIKNNVRLSDSLQPIEPGAINQGLEPVKIRYQERRFFGGIKAVENITGRIKSQPSSL